MNIAIVHYHLNRGGVGQVIASHLRGLERAARRGERWRIALVHGGRREGWPAELDARLGTLELDHWTIPDLDYVLDGTATPHRLARQLENQLRASSYLPESTVIHAHNHALGKNPSLPGCLAQLAARGYRLLLQLHDFAEDFRPLAYAALWDALHTTSSQELGSLLYPQANQIHYAVLNRRDALTLQRAGLDPARLHVLPNPVEELGPAPSREEARKTWSARFGVPLERRLVLYPVRGIARKNLGEMLLWSVLAGNDVHFATSLPPLNPAEQPLYQRWRKLAAELDLNCTFETGAPGGLTFAESVSAADRFVTTSLAEGFGMVFLESWRTGRQLAGRDLPEITADFVRAGIQFDLLRPSVWVPVDWIGMDEFCASIERSFRRVMQRYRQDLTNAETLRDEIRGLVHDGCVDFGTLSAEQQQHVIGRAHHARGRELILARNGWIDQAVAAWDDEMRPVAERNARIVQENYSLDACGRVLAELYRQVASSPCSARLEPLPRCETILHAFLKLAQPFARCGPNHETVHPPDHARQLAAA